MRLPHPHICSHPAPKGGTVGRCLELDLSPGSCYLHLSFKSSVFWYCFPICVMEAISPACIFRGLEETTGAALLSLEEHSAACSVLLLKALPELPTSTSGSFSFSFLQIISYTHALLGSAERPFSVGGTFWRREGAWSSLTTSRCTMGLGA